MARNPEDFKNSRKQPQSRIQELADAVLSARTDGSPFYKLLNGGHYHAQEKVYDSEELKKSFDRPDQYDRAREVLDALKKLRIGNSVNVDTPLYSDKHYGLTIREALAQGSEVIKGFIHFEKKYAEEEGVEIIRNPDDYIKIGNAIFPISGFHSESINSPNDIDDLKAQASSHWLSGKQAIKSLLATRAKFDALLEALPPERQRG